MSTPGVTPGTAGAEHEDPTPAALRPLKAIDRVVQRVEVALCCAALALMILLAFTQVILRTFRGEVLQPVAWFDNVARNLVIWVGVLGASLATAEGRHISIEALPKLFSAGGRRRNDVVINLVSVGITGVLLALAIVYMMRIQVPNEAYLFKVEALDLSVYRWPFLLVVPIGLAIIGARFALRAAESALMSDAQFRAREEQAERDVAGQKTEDAEVAALLAHDQQVARESGRPPTLTMESARAEVRRALHSDRAALAPPQDDASAPAAAAPQADKAAPGRPGATDETARLAAQTPGSGRRREPGAPGRSTDEMPVYRELADDADLVEPEIRVRGVPADTTDPDAEPGGDLGDLVDDAVEAAAERVKLGSDESDEDGASERVSVVVSMGDGPGSRLETGGTDRLPPPLPAPLDEQRGPASDTNRLPRPDKGAP